MFSTMVNKISVFVFTFLVVCNCEPPPPQYGAPFQGAGPTGAPLNSYGTPNYDGSGGNNYGHGDNHYNDHSEPKSYEFGYQVKDDYTGTNYKRQETSDGNQVNGEYRVQLPDGRTQIVTYYADWQTGFHADVRYEGTAQYPENYNTFNGYGNNGQGYNNNAQAYNNNAQGYNNNAQAFNNQLQGYNNGYNNNNNNGYNNAQNYNYNENNGYGSGSATSSVSIKDYSGPSTPYNTGGGHNDGYNNNNNNNNNYDHNAASGYNYPSPDFGNKVRRSTEKDEKTPAKN